MENEMIQQLQERVKELENENILLKNKLKPYTDNTKRYYEKNKEEIIQKVKKYKEEHKYISPAVSQDVIKERNKKAYLKRKEKLNKIEKNEFI